MKKIRHEARMKTVQMLFELDFNSQKISDILEHFWQQQPFCEEGRTFAERLLRGVIDHHCDIDDRLKAYAINWDIHRMGAVDRNVMRMALYEMFYCDDIPPVVSINEAVDIAKELSSMESGRFVNGILDRACKDVNRPARTALRKSV